MCIYIYTYVIFICVSADAKFAVRAACGIDIATELSCALKSTTAEGQRSRRITLDSHLSRDFVHLQKF